MERIVLTCDLCGEELKPRLGGKAWVEIARVTLDGSPSTKKAHICFPCLPLNIQNIHVLGFGS